MPACSDVAARPIHAIGAAHPDSTVYGGVPGSSAPFPDDRCSTTVARRGRSPAMGAAALRAPDRGAASPHYLEGPPIALTALAPPYAVRVHQPSDRCDDVELDLALAVGAKVAVPEPYALRFDGHSAPMIGLPDPIELPRLEPR